MGKRFAADFTNRGVVQNGDKLLIQNITSGEVMYCTVAELHQIITTALALKANLASPVLVTPTIGIATATSVNGVKMIGQSFTIPGSTTKTFTVSLAGVNRGFTFDISFGMHEGGDGGEGALKHHVTGYKGDASYYAVKELDRSNGGSCVISVVTEAANSYSFTVEATDIPDIDITMFAIGTSLPVVTMA
jgi:hypothetical protein